MATGAVLGMATIGAANANLYTASGAASVVVNICNTNTAAVSIRLGIGTTSATIAQHLWKDKVIPANDSIQYTGIMLDATNKYLVGYGSTTGIDFIAMGVA